MINIDLAKSYDKTYQTYIRLVVIQCGFSLEAVKWIWACITIVNFVVLINRVASKFFIPSRRLRRGCLVCPYLFLVVMEGLSMDLN